MIAISAGASSNPVGKYQVAAGVPDAVILNTQTGEAWGMVSTNPGSPENKSDKFFSQKLPAINSAIVFERPQWFKGVAQVLTKIFGSVEARTVSHQADA